MLTNKKFCIRNIKTLWSSLVKGAIRYKGLRSLCHTGTIFRYRSFSYRISLFQVELIYKGQEIPISFGTGNIHKSFLLELFLTNTSEMKSKKCIQRCL